MRLLSRGSYREVVIAKSLSRGCYREDVIARLLSRCCYREVVIVIGVIVKLLS